MWFTVLLHMEELHKSLLIRTRYFFDPTLFFKESLQKLLFWSILAHVLRIRIFCFKDWRQQQFQEKMQQNSVLYVPHLVKLNYLHNWQTKIILNKMSRNIKFPFLDSTGHFWSLWPIPPNTRDSYWRITYFLWKSIFSSF